MIRFRRLKFVREIGCGYCKSYTYINGIKEFIKVHKEEKELYGKEWEGTWLWLVERVDLIRNIHNSFFKDKVYW